MYSLLNIAGLGVGIACAALIFLWVEDEVFAGACLLVTLIAMLTVCSIALKAAMADPMNAIKSE